MNRRLADVRLSAPVVAGVLLFTGALAVPRAASAGVPSPRQVHREIHEHLFDVLEGVHDVLRVLDDVPVILDSLARRDFVAYYGGSEYYGPHRHYHEVYRFPIRLDGRVIYRPHAYCGDRLFVNDAYASGYPDPYLAPYAWYGAGAWSPPAYRDTWRDIRRDAWRDRSYRSYRYDSHDARQWRHEREHRGRDRDRGRETWRDDSRRHRSGRDSYSTDSRPSHGRGDRHGDRQHRHDGSRH